MQMSAEQIAKSQAAERQLLTYSAHQVLNRTTILIDYNMKSGKKLVDCSSNLFYRDFSPCNLRYRFKLLKILEGFSPSNVHFLTKRVPNMEVQRITVRRVRRPFVVRNKGRRVVYFTQTAHCMALHGAAM